MIKLVHVAIPGTSKDFFDYGTDETLPKLGTRVLVPFRGGKKVGLCIGFSVVEKVNYRLLTILSVLDDEPVIDDEILTLTHFTKDYYQAPLSEVLKNALPKKIRQGEALSLKKTTFYQLLKQASLPNKNATKQRAAINVLQAFDRPLSQEELRNHNVSTATLKVLLQKQVLSASLSEQLPKKSTPNTNDIPRLTEEQKPVVEVLMAITHHFYPALLFGVTGSGKTEVYFRLIEQCLNQGKQVLILVPEIGLTPQLTSRVQNRFYEVTALLHSGLNDSERFFHWQHCKRGLAKILIGTRSAVFTPMKDLGLIIVDEEHDASFKQQEGMRYSARSLALVRAQKKNIPIILGSATPSLESLHNAALGKYHLFHLHQRAKTTQKTLFRLIDLRNKYLTDGLCEETLSHIRNHLKQKNQVMVFINRRGYAPVFLCHQCAYIPDCTNCSAHLTFHAQKQVLQCHHCGYSTPLPSQCPSCGAREFVPVGCGTERVANYLKSVFEDQNIIRIDRDTTRRKDALPKVLEEINSGAADIIVGTQMLAKGHHFKRLNLVVLLDTDTGLFSQDFRGLERLGQLITQVAGRAGREGEGEVIIQTHQVDNPYLNALVQKGYQVFSKALLKERQQCLWPPYSRLCLIRAKARDLKQATTALNEIKLKLYAFDDTTALLGPAPALMERRAGHYQMQLLLKAQSHKRLLLQLKELRSMMDASPKISKGVVINFDVDCEDLN